MLPRKENELLTRVGPGTAMGETLRRYWVPAALAREVALPDCPPVRVKLLGEDLVAFRDSDGRIGLVDEFCPHRRVSLFFGRNEECGLRCVYHGWKFDVEGRCVDMMNEPAELSFKQKVSITSYPMVEAGGILWAYMGPPALRPPLPQFAWTRTPATHLDVSKVIQVSNWEYSLGEPLTAEDRLGRGLGNGPLDVDQKTFRSTRNKRNNYLLDRQVQKTETFTGIEGINTQDRATQEGMGPIVDRSKEH